jgi:hypothetical protein
MIVLMGLIIEENREMKIEIGFERCNVPLMLSGDSFGVYPPPGWLISPPDLNKTKPAGEVSFYFNHDYFKSLVIIFYLSKYFFGDWQTKWKSSSLHPSFQVCQHGICIMLIHFPHDPFRQFA